MGYHEEYERKRVTAAEAVRIVKPGDWIDYGFCVGHPVELDRALAARMEAEHDLTGLNFRGALALWQPEVTKIPDAVERITWNSWHTSGIERRLCATELGFYAPIRFSEVPRYYRENIAHVDVVMIQVSPMDSHGFFNFGPSTTYLAALCEVAETIIVEVNPHLPVALGGFEEGIHLSDVNLIVEGGAPMARLPAAEASPVDKAVAELIVPHIPDGACLQLGIGGMPNAVGGLIARSDLKDLGVHSEMYVDAFVDMAAAGKITGAKKALNRGRAVFSFAAGSQKLYDYIHQNRSVMAAPVDYVNDAGVIAAHDNFISINNAVEVDLTGQVASESAGTRHISGAGGQLDFVLGAYRSKGGKSFICCSSTMRCKDGSVKSRINPTITPGGVITATRTNLHYLVTEYGMANLKGLSTWQRAEAIIALAHPDFREALISQAASMGIWRQSNK